MGVTAETNQQASGLTLNLFGPGMTALHKVGLAGLWMTLETFEKDPTVMGRLKKAGGSWERTETSVILNWTKEPKDFFESLFKESFKIDKKGFFWFPALGQPMSHPQHAVVLQEAILGTLLQHGQTRSADKSTDPKGYIPPQDDDALLVLKFHRVTWYKHQDAKYSASQFNSLAGWAFPGGAVRHVGLGQSSTSLEENPAGTLALRYLLIGGIYFEIHRRASGKRPRYSLVIIDVSNLKKYAEARKCFLQYGVQQLYAAGTSDAGLRVLAELQGAGLLQDVGSTSCRVISFGTVPWSSQQKTRVELFNVSVASEQALRTFSTCRQVLFPKLIKLKQDKDQAGTTGPGKDRAFWDIPQTPDLVAKNLSEGRQWWENFADFVADKNTRDHVFKYERGGLTKMVQDKETLPEGSERTFVLACQEALRRHMGRKFARPGGADWGTEFEKVRVSIARTKNLSSFRETITDFWSRGGSLQKGSDTLLKADASWWEDILPLLNEKNWRKAKDLALLALASYPSAEEEQSEIKSD
jgi:CRISPR-associated protein Cas8a1/Csx13